MEIYFGYKENDDDDDNNNNNNNNNNNVYSDYEESHSRGK